MSEWTTSARRVLLRLDYLLVCVRGLWHRLFGYPLVIEERYVARFAADAELPVDAMRAALRCYTPERQRLFALMLDTRDGLGL